jgi:hypothetical protein
MNTESGSRGPEDGAKPGAVSQHVRELVATLLEQVQKAKTSVDTTVEVNRKKKSSGGVNGV